MKININKLMVIGLGLVGFLLSTSQAFAATTQKCFMPVRADLYVSLTVPGGTYKLKVADDAVYSYIKAQSSVDKATQINQFRQLITNIPSLLLTRSIADSLRNYYESQISSLQSQERREAIEACVASLKPQRLAAMNGVPAPHVFQYLGNIWLGEDFEHPPVVGHSDCNGRTVAPYASCKKPSDLK